MRLLFVDEPAGLNSVETVPDNSINIFQKIITTVIYKTFRYFVWTNHIKVLLPANGTVKVPVVFNHNFAYSSISENYIIAFDNTDYLIPNEVMTFFFFSDDWLYKLINCTRFINRIEIKRYRSHK